ncbi:MAG: autotransporter domain-containing protein, partial [Candidatus Orphnella occulta]|nr:autotransporter domain-containing protein [Candidatus Orphnella occulta]
STTLDLDTADTSTIGGTLTAGTLDFSDDADLTVTGTTAIAGAITVGTTGDGTLEMDGASNTIGGDIGALATRLGELDIDGTTTVTGNTYTVLTNVGAATGFTGDVNSTTLDLDAAATSTIGGTLDATTLDYSADADLTVTGTTAIAGAITVGTTGDGTLEMDGASNTIGGDIGALATRLGELDIDGTTTITGDTYTVLTNVGAATGFTGDVNSTTLDLDAAATSTIGGTLDATTLDYSADADLTVTGVATVTDITNTTGSDDKGTLEFNGVATIAGQVGALGSALNSVITGATGTTSTFSGDAYVTDFELDGTGTVNMDGTLTGDLNFGANGILLLAASKNITGNVDNTTGADGAGTLTFKGASTIGNAIGSTNSLLAVNVGDGLVAGGVVTMGSNISATTTTVESGGTLQLNAARTITGNLTLADTIGSGSGGIIDVGTNTLSLSGTRIFTMPTNTSLDLEITSGSYGSIDSRVAGVGAAAVINNNSDVNITVANGYYIPTGVEYTIVNTAGAGVGGALSSLTMNTIGNRHVQFLPAGSSGNLIAKSDRSANGFASDATDVNARAVGEVLDNVTSPTTDMTTVLNTLEGLSGSDTDSALNTMEPSVDGGIIGAGNLSIGNMINAISNHFSMVRGAASGVSTGDADAEVKNTVVSTGDADAEVKNTGAKEMWAQAFGTYAKQDERKGIEGYRADVRGGALGVDLFASDKGRFGIGGGYSYNRIKPKKSSLQKTEADNMQGSLYYSYNNDVNYLGAEAIYFDLVGSFAYNMYEGKRNISVGSGINRTAKAEYDGQQYTTYGEAGYHIPAGGIDLTPLASLQYTHLHLEGYTEKGADALNLNVDKQDYDLLEMGLGLKISSIMRNEGFDIIPSVRGKWLYDFIADKTEVTSRFTGGGASFKTEGAKPAKSSFDIGGTLTFLGKSNVQIDFDYDFNIKNDYQSHNGAVTFKYGF